MKFIFNFSACRMWLPAVVAILPLLHATAVAEAEKVKMLHDFDTVKDQLRITANTDTVIREENGKLIVETKLPFQWPGIFLRALDGGRIDISGYQFFAADIRNIGSTQLALRGYIDGEKSDGVNDCATGGVTLNPGESRTLLVRYNQRGEASPEIKLFGTHGYPKGFGGPANLDVKNIVKFAILVDAPGNSYKYEVDNIRLLGEYQPPDPAVRDPEKFFPLVDKFGQYRHAEWPGKIHSDEEMARRIAEEDADLAAHPGADDRDQWGGYAHGPQLKATGFFRTEKYDGKWYFVDPDGRLFWSHGITDVNSEHIASTALDERANWFAEIPPSDGVFGCCFSRCKTVFGNGYYKGKQPMTFDFGIANLIRKYGEAYEQPFIERTAARFKSWGMNTYGNWTNWPVAFSHKVPYVAQIYMWEKWIEGSEGLWSKFPDVFDPECIAIAKRRARSQMIWNNDPERSMIDDPWCIGFFGDNEIDWGNELALAKSVIASPATQAAKRTFAEELRGKYGSIEALNAAWKSSYRDWDAFLASTEQPGSGAETDLRNFNARIIDRYFEVSRAVLKEVAPNQLYLGVRFNGRNQRVEKAAVKYCDVVSYNLYQHGVADFAPGVEADVPVMSTEWHIGALDRGQFFGGIRQVANQQERAHCYMRYVEGALRNPRMVGTHFYKYRDDAVTGWAAAGGSFQCGFLDVCDNPYQETVDAARKVGYRMYDIRVNGAALDEETE